MPRTDNDLEFISKDFNRLCWDERIERHKIVPGNPQQNEVIEIMNKTVLERIRCMVFFAGLPKNFWGEAANSTSFFIN